MAYNDNSNGSGTRQMFKGNWSCGSCGAAITSLPFEPDSDRLGQLKCRDCHATKKSFGGGGHGVGTRQMFKGNWTCGSCGTAINELPFEPDPERLSQISCRDCHRKNRPSRGDRF